MASLINLHSDKEFNQPATLVNPKFVISVTVTPKKETFLKLIDGRQVQYFGEYNELMRAWNEC